MDVDWFKKKQKERGVTADQIADIMGRSRTSVSNIYSGNQKMSLEWAQAFAQALDTPIDEILSHAGALPQAAAKQVTSGFSEGDAAPFSGPPGATQRASDRASTFGGEKPGIDVWTVRTEALTLNGIMPGDQILVDSNMSERARAGDFVIAQDYNWQTGTAVTLLRRFEPPVLVSASSNPDLQRVHVVDGRNLVIRGVVTAIWRDLRQ